MPQTAEPMPRHPEPAPNRKRWTRRECAFLQDSGLLAGRYELVNGEIIDKMGQKPPHRITLVLVHAWLVVVFGAMFVQDQSPIHVAEADDAENEPEPDLAVTKEPALAYLERHPGPGDLELVVEVSDTTLRFDRSVKAALYARAGIPEYWVLDLTGRQLYVHRRPVADAYEEISVYAPEERAAALARPDSLVPVADLLPPSA